MGVVLVSVSDGFTILSATPDVYIPVGVVYTSPGAIANITAIVRPSSPPRWLYGNTTITTATDHTLQNSSAPFYRQVFDGGRGIATLQVLNVAASILGMYRVQVTSGSTSREDQVQLLFPGQIREAIIIALIAGVKGMSMLLL